MTEQRERSDSLDKNLAKQFSFNTALEKKISAPVKKNDRKKTSSLKFDITQYHVHFDAIFTNKDMFAAFMAHLQMEINPEPLEFLVEVDKIQPFENKDNAEETIKQVKNIVELFISSGAKKELNLSSSSKDALLATLKDQLSKDKEWILETSPKSVFYPVQRTIILELKMDVFPRFVRGALCHEVVEKYKGDNTVISLKQTVQYPYTNSDFYTLSVTDQDFEFMKSLSKDTFDWELLGSLTSKLNTFHSNHNYLPNVTLLKNCSIGKFECIFPFSFEHVVCCCVPLIEAEVFDVNVMRNKNLEHFDHEQLKEMIKKENPENYKLTEKYGKRACSVNVMDIYLPFPLKTPRKYPVTTSVDFDAETTTFTMVHKPMIHKSFWDKKPEEFDFTKKHKHPVYLKKTDTKETVKDLYFMVDLQSYHIQKLDDNRTSFKQIHVFDLCGWASNRALQKASLKDRGVGLRKTLVEHMQSKGDLTFESYAETLKKDSVGRLILDLDIPGLKKKFTDAQLAKMGLEPSTPTVVKKDVVFETITPEEPKPKEEEVIIVKEEEVKQEEPKEEIKEEVKQEEVPVVVETKEEPKEETKEEEPKEEPKVSSVPLTKVDDETSTLAVPNKLHQYCIGKGGSIIKEISSTSGSKLNLEGDNMLIKGGDINKAVELVMNALSNVGWFYENNSWVERTKQDELWKKYRGEAQKEVELRNECYEKSKKAFEEGNKELASQLSEEGKSHDEKWKMLTAEAASNIFNEMNQNNDKNTIDLHGLFVDEALGFVKERLSELKGNGSTLSIITGAGNHSAGGQALIKPKIHELLKAEGLTFTEEKNGQVDVQM